ncbi:MAG: AAA family ATPase, partial [Acidobacteria bacterium]|nr:AAA family ATPase [Acidobacteriota bacterium]
MLSLLKLKNVALIDSLEIEFGEGLNLLTGETGSGKSIIVDSLGALTGARVSADLIKQGEQSAKIEGLFSLTEPERVTELVEKGGIEFGDGELIIRRELFAAGKNRIFVNNHLVTQTFLRSLGPHLVDIHGQGEQAALFDTALHMAMLDRVSGTDNLRTQIAEAFRQWSEIKQTIANLQRDDANKLQLIDILKFQVSEITAARMEIGEDA